VRVFLSYRRGDAGGHAGRLADALVQRLGPRSVFQDVTAISPGQDYTVAIDRALADSDAALVVIGPGWLTAVTPQGTRRLLEADDYVRLELARALDRDIRVIPILVGGARLPEAAELPGDLRGWPSGRPWSCTTKPGTRTSPGWSGHCAASQPCQPRGAAAGCSPGQR
jgi:TIR domain